MATNEILRFCQTDTLFNLLTQIEYDADPDRLTGNKSPPPASKKLVNKALRQLSVMAAGLAQFSADNQLADVTDDLDQFQMADIIANAIASLAGNATGDYLQLSAEDTRPGWAYCNGTSYDMVGPSSSQEIKDLGNYYEFKNKLLVYGYGIDSYITTKPMVDTIDHEASIVGVAAAPDAHTSGFIIAVTQTGTVSVSQIVRVTTNAGNTIVPGAYYELFAPTGRSTIYWFQVDGGGSAPSFPGALVQMVPILSTDTADQVADAILANSFQQYRVPDKRGLGSRAMDDGAGVDPDAATRTGIYGNIVGDVVGSLQGGALEGHTHIGPNGFQFSSTSPSPGFRTYTSGTGNPNGFESNTGGVDPSANISTETRGKNMYEYWLVKF